MCKVQLSVLYSQCHMCATICSVWDHMTEWYHMCRRSHVMSIVCLPIHIECY